MLIKFFKHGTGRGSAPVAYLTQAHGANGVKRSIAPVVVCGSPTLCRNIIDSISRKHKYTSGVIAWHRDDAPTQLQQDQAIQLFESVAFAGLERDQYHCLWVRHEHCGNVELHFLTPKTELRSGKQLNIKPPGIKHQSIYDTIRDNLNARHNWACPDDPARAQLIRPTIHGDKTTVIDVRRQLNDYLIMRNDSAVSAGIDYTRADVISDLIAINGVTVSRQTKSTISVTLTGHDRPIRLKGAIYEQDYSGLRHSPERCDISETQANKADRRSRVEETSRDIRKIITERSERNRAMFGATPRDIIADKRRPTVNNSDSRRRDKPLPKTNRKDGYNQRHNDKNTRADNSITSVLRETTNTTLGDDKMVSTIDSNHLHNRTCDNDVRDNISADNRNMAARDYIDHETARVQTQRINRDAQIQPCTTQDEYSREADRQGLFGRLHDTITGIKKRYSTILNRVSNLVSRVSRLCKSIAAARDNITANYQRAIKQSTRCISGDRYSYQDNNGLRDSPSIGSQIQGRDRACAISNQLDELMPVKSKANHIETIISKALRLSADCESAYKTPEPASKPQPYRSSGPSM